MPMFVRLTLAITVGVVALIALAFLLKIVFIGAVFAAIALAIVSIVRTVRRMNGRGELTCPTPSWSGMPYRRP